MKFGMLKKLYGYDKANNTFKIDVQLEDYRDAYSDWDYSPFNNRDLDDDLIEYLIECSTEIPFRYGLVINYHILKSSYDKMREERSILGMHNFFLYQLRKLNNQRMRVVGDMFTFGTIGTILLTGAFYMPTFFKGSFVVTILSEGLFIGGWVMFWEVFSAWFFSLKSIKIKRKHFMRLHKAEIVFTYDIGGTSG